LKLKGVGRKIFGELQ